MSIFLACIKSALQYECMTTAFLRCMRSASVQSGSRRDQHVGVIIGQPPVLAKLYGVVLDVLTFFPDLAGLGVVRSSPVAPLDAVIVEHRIR